MIKNYKKTFCAITFFAIVLFGLFFYYYHGRLFGQEPRVLGSSINNFYANKEIDISNVPRKKDKVEDPNILADSAVLIEDKSKYPLYEKNKHEPVSVASITKVMTYLIAREYYSLDDLVTVGAQPVSVIGSKINLKEGEIINVESLLNGLLVSSGNDAAYALANHMGLDEFVKKMNEKALVLGMNDSHFVDPAGLDDNGRSSSFDISILFSYALNDELFVDIVSTSEKEVFSQDGTISHSLKNSNRLVTGEIPLEGIIGGKTGFTFDAGHTLVCAAQRGDIRLISVILKTSVNSKTASAYESQKLLNWGFDSFDF